MDQDHPGVKSGLAMLFSLLVVYWLLVLSVAAAKNESLPALPKSPGPSPRSGILSMAKHIKEKQLVEDLFRDYDPSLRPVLRREDNVTVTLGISVHQIIDVDERNQVIKVSVWVRQVWHNPFLQWNKSYYGDIGQINVDPDRVWKPDIFLYTNAEDDSDGSLERSQTQIKLNSEGKNVWLSPGIMSSSCKINVKFFPFDEQHCKLKFGSWTYNGLELDLAQEASFADIKSFVSNGEWDLIDVPCTRNEVKYVCCVEPYPDITFVINVRRRTLFYLFNLVIPCLIIVGMTALSFYVPPESGERISLVITNLLALTVFMLLVAEIIPPTSEELSIITIFYSCCIFEVGLTLIATCIILKYHFANPNIHAMPAWVRYVFLHTLGHFVLRKPPPSEPEDPDKTQDDLETDYFMGCNSGSNYDEYADVTEANHAQSVWTRRSFDTVLGPRCKRHARDEILPLGLMNGGPSDTSHPSPGNPLTNSALRKQEIIAKNVAQIAKLKMDQEKHDQQRGEWIYVAAVLDRLLLFVFILILIISACVIYTRIPDYDNA